MEHLHLSPSPKGKRRTMRLRRGSSTGGDALHLESSSTIIELPMDETNPRPVRPKGKSNRRRFRKRNRMAASRQMMILFCGIAAAVFFIVLIMTFTSIPDKPEDNRDNLPPMIRQAEHKEEPQTDHRDLRPPREFARYTKDAPECDDMDPTDVRFTLVTQLSSDRIWMMEEHCKRWDSISPISVAVFTNQSKEDVTKQLNELGCDPFTLTVQVLSMDKYHPDDYPVNVLRTMALSAVTTSHVMYSDVDFWESEDLHEILQHEDVRELLARDSKRAIVVPAFQLFRQCKEWRDCRENNVPKMPRNRQDLINLMTQKHPAASPFDPTNAGGHGSTLYKTWFRQHDSDVIDIPCIKSNRYEPYMVFRYCRDLPPFHEEFSGYGKNKMTTVMQMRRTGYQFSQMGGGFVVHYPHLDSESRMEWNEKPKELEPYFKNGKWHQRKAKDVHGVDWMQYKRGRVDQLFVEFKTWLKNEVPDESRVPRCEHFEDDDAKLWINRD